MAVAAAAAAAAAAAVAAVGLVLGCTVVRLATVVATAATRGVEAAVAMAVGEDTALRTGRWAHLPQERDLRES